MKIIALFSLLFIGFFGYAKESYTINANVISANNTTFYLTYKLGDKEVRDSVNCLENHFTFKGVFPEPVLCTLSNSTNGQIKILVAENAAIQLNGNVEKMFDLQVLNSIENDLYNDFKNKNLTINGDYRIQLKASGADIHDHTNVAYITLQRRADSLTNIFVQQHADKSAAALAIIDNFLTKENRSKASAAYAVLSPKVQNTFYGKRIKTFVDAQNAIAPGHAAPNFTLKNIDGKTVSLSDYKGKYVLVDFWASWCGPCRKEHPQLIENYKRYGDKVIVFLSISLDSSPESWKTAIAKDGLLWTQLNAPEAFSSSVADDYGVKSVPFNIIVDEAGIIKATNLRGEDLSKWLVAAFPNK